MRTVIKIGSNVLLGNKQALDLELIKKIVKEIKHLHQKGHQVIIVTSGAVAVGQIILKKADGFRSVAAAIGQPELIRHYAKFFADDSIKIAQILLSPNTFKDRDSYDHLKKTLQEVINKRIIPIINENDVTILPSFAKPACRQGRATEGEQSTFGDNDSLAAMISVIAEADKLMYLTNTRGLYSADPNLDPDAKIIKKVNSIDLEIQKMCSKKVSSLGRGGMLSKLKGAKLATTCGIETYIICGLQSDNISKLLVQDQEIGTKFIAQKSQLTERKKWLLIGSVSQGTIIVDNGAREALENKNSLLAVGIRKIKGNFVKGEFVNITNKKGEVFAFGLSNYSSKELLLLNDLRDKIQIKEKYKKEIVHIDNLTLLK